MIGGYRDETLWFAYLLHRVSGICLALYLPFHFYVLSVALNGSDAMDGWLRIGEVPVVRFGFVVLVLLLAIHLFGGLRLLAIEFLPWNPRQKTLVAAAVATAFFAACVFFTRGVL